MEPLAGSDTQPTSRKWGSSSRELPVLATSIICSKKGLGQQDEEDAIGLGGRWPFHLPFEDNELLA
jgi:hypothetical protein